MFHVSPALLKVTNLVTYSQFTHQVYTRIDFKGTQNFRRDAVFVPFIDFVCKISQLPRLKFK